MWIGTTPAAASGGGDDGVNVREGGLLQWRDNFLLLNVSLVLYNDVVLLVTLRPLLLMRAARQCRQLLHRRLRLQIDSPNSYGLSGCPLRRDETNSYWSSECRMRACSHVTDVTHPLA